MRKVTKKIIKNTAYAYHMPLIITVSDGDLAQYLTEKHGEGLVDQVNLNKLHKEFIINLNNQEKEFDSIITYCFEEAFEKVLKKR